MYASVHTDRNGRVFVSDDHRAAGSDGNSDVALTATIALPAGARLVPLARDALAFGRDGRMREIGRGRLAMAAILPRGYTRLLFPSYAEDPAAPALDALPYAAVGADREGEVVVAAAEHAPAVPGGGAHASSRSELQAALRARPANKLMRQLTRCAREHECAAAQAALAGQGELPVPVGARPAERPRLPLDLRSGYAGSPTERAAIHPSASEIAEMAGDAAARGAARISFGRACDGEPLLALRVVEDAVARIRGSHPGIDLHLETSGSDAAGLRRLIEAGLSSVTVRLGAATPETYRLLHGPIAHGWSDVRASLHVAAARGIRPTVALLVLPGVTDRAVEIDAIVALLGELPGGKLELRDLGADPARTLAAFPAAKPLGVRILLDRVAEADHFRLDGLGGEAASASRGGPRPAAGSPR